MPTAPSTFAPAKHNAGRGGSSGLRGSGTAVALRFRRISSNLFFPGFVANQYVNCHFPVTPEVMVPSSPSPSLAYGEILDPAGRLLNRLESRDLVRQNYRCTVQKELPGYFHHTDAAGVVVGGGGRWFVLRERVRGLIVK